MADSLTDRVKRKIREGEGGSWSEADELDWLQRHPEDRPQGWVDPEEAIKAYDDFVPEAEYDDSDRPQNELKERLDQIDILDVYHRLGVKGFQANPGGKRESIMVRCPDPAHPDEKPDAWVNLDKQVYVCGPCGNVGGDKYHIAARWYGHPIDASNTIIDFPQLLERLGADLGIVVTKTPGGSKVIEEREVIYEDEVTKGLAPIVKIIPDLDEEQAALLSEAGIMIDWLAIAEPGTFLWDWMHATTIDDLPHEYYFFLGLMALAAAIGPEVVMKDFKPIYGNLYLCLYGGTGTGKSRALSPFQTLLEAAVPYDPDPSKPSMGTKMLASPGSSEALIQSFVHPLLDPTTGAVSTTHTAPVRGLLRIEEFASFVSRANRVGNPMKETLIELYDAYGRDVTHYARTAGMTVARSPYAQVVTTTQPKAIHAYLSRMDADSGFMNRWVFAVGKRRVKRISHGGAYIDIDDSINQLKAVKAWASSGREMDLEGDARRFWDEFYETEITNLYEQQDESMFSRMDLTLKKLIILLTANEKLPMPTADVVEKATKLYPYLRATYRMFARDIRTNDDEMCQEAILNSIKNFKKKTATSVNDGVAPSLRELVQRLEKTYARKIIERSLQILEVLDLVQVQVIKPKAGPSTKRYDINVG